MEPVTSAIAFTIVVPLADTMKLPLYKVEVIVGVEPSVV